MQFSLHKWRNSMWFWSVSLVWSISHYFVQPKKIVNLFSSRLWKLVTLLYLDWTKKSKEWTKYKLSGFWDWTIFWGAVLLVSLLDWSNGQPICTLTNLFLSGQKQNCHYNLADQFFSNFFYSLSKTRLVQNPEKCQFTLLNQQLSTLISEWLKKLEKNW